MIIDLSVFIEAILLIAQQDCKGKENFYSADIDKPFLPARILFEVGICNQIRLWDGVKIHFVLPFSGNIVHPG